MATVMKQKRGPGRPRKPTARVPLGIDVVRRATRLGERQGRKPGDFLTDLLRPILDRMDQKGSR
jgi:hypothetical protein